MARLQITLSLPDGPFTGTPAEVRQNIFDELLQAALMHHQEAAMDLLSWPSTPSAMVTINAAIQHHRSMADALKLVRIEDITVLEK